MSYVTMDQLEKLLGLLGAEMGKDEKRIRGETKAFVAEEIATVIRFVSAQARTIDRLSRTVDAIMASQGKASSGQTATAPKARRRA